MTKSREWTVPKSGVRWRPALMICLSLATIILEAPGTKSAQQFGEVHFRIACKPEVQKEFDLAVAMLHTFSFPAEAGSPSAIRRFGTMPRPENSKGLPGKEMTRSTAKLVRHE